jgi:hypothetical protein
MKLAIVVLILLLFIPTSAAAIECRSEKGDTSSWWSWRIVDSRKCWYVGRRHIGKSRLHWGNDAPVRNIQDLPERRAAPAVPPRAEPLPDPARDLDTALRSRADQLRTAPARVIQGVLPGQEPDPVPVPVPTPRPLPPPPTLPQEAKSLDAGTSIAVTALVAVLAFLISASVGKREPVDPNMMKEPEPGRMPDLVLVRFPQLPSEW